jgi:molybdopterin-guanine dinucleotide biosynthesis protein A
MGTDKALLDFDGKPLIQHLLERLNTMAQEIIITTNHPDDYHFLGLPIFTDLVPERGALGGLYTALNAASQPFVAVVACDMPFASAAILHLCLDYLAPNPKLDAVIPSSIHGLEPLHAVYRRETCLSAVKAAIEDNQWKMIGWHKDVNVHIIPLEEIARLDPHGIVFINVNTPEEYEAAVRKLNRFS